MTISVVGSATDTTSSSTVNLTVPAGIIAGDHIFVTAVGPWSSAAPVVSSPAFTVLDSYSAPNTKIVLAHRIADGTESTVTVTGTDVVPCTLTVFRGATGAAIVDSNTGSGSTSTPAVVTNTIGAENASVLFLTLENGVVSGSIDPTTPASYTSVDGASSPPGDKRHTAVKVWNTAVSSASPSTTWTLNGTVNAWRSVNVELAGVVSAGPNVDVGAGFGSDPFDTSPTYTDISAYIDPMAGVHIERGRQPGLGQPSPGTCTFVLRNSDGRFTPGNTSGPYGSDVKVRTPIQVSVAYNGTSYTRFTGFVQSWELVWPGGVTESSKVRVVATDLLGVLADTSIRRPHTETLLLTSPTALYPMTEADAPCADATDNDQPAARKMQRGGGSGTCRVGDRSGRFGSARRMRTVFVKAGGLDADSRQGWRGLAATVDFKSATTSLGFGGWVRYDADAPSVRAYIASLELNSTYSLLLWADSEYGLCAGNNSDRATSPTISVSKGNILDGRWHHVYALYDESTYKLALHVDGVVLGNVATGLGAGSGLIAGSGRLVVGGADFPATNPSYTAMQRGWLSHWGVWTDSAATGLDTAAVYADGRRQSRPDSRSSDRIDWLFDTVGWPTPNRNIEIGVADIPSSEVPRSSALEYAQTCADGELGYLYVTRGGLAAFDARPHRYAPTTSSASMSWHDVGQVWATDVDSVVNIVDVSFTAGEGGTVTLKDPSSRTTYGRRRLSLGTGLEDANAARGAAEYVLAVYATPLPRLQPWRWDFLTSPSTSDNAAMLGLDLNDRMTLTSIPSPAHTSSADVWVESLSETISRDDWSVTVATSPRPVLFASGTWVLGTSTLGTNTILTY